MRTPCAPLAASLLLLLTPTATLVHAQEAGPSEVSLTIYSNADPAAFDPRIFGRDNPYSGWNGAAPQVPGFGVVRERRGVDLQEGRTSLAITDVAEQVDPTTVTFRSLTAPDTTTVLEQDFRFDLVGTNRLLERFVDRRITLSVGGRDGAPREEITGTLLAFDTASLTLREGPGVRIVPRTPEPPTIVLPRLPEGFVTRPTLAWEVQAERAGKHDVEVSYQTDGLTWRADYTALVAPDESTLDLSAWVTLVNRSGASYRDARLKLVAGDVQRIQPRGGYLGGGMGGMGGGMRQEPGFAEKPFFEYHLYTLGRPATLPDRSTKQLELFPARMKVPVTKRYVFYGELPDRDRFTDGGPERNRELGPEGNTKVGVHLALKNDEASGLGLPLPAGRVRVTKRDDADGAAEFLGEDVIDHTPRGEDLLIKVGSAFDVVGERRQVDFQVDDSRREMSESIVVELRNQKDTPITVTVKETLFRWSTWQVTAKSHDFTRRDQKTILFDVPVPARGKAQVSYTVKYTW
jgi:hypothetical protein